MRHGVGDSDDGSGHGRDPGWDGTSAGTPDVHRAPHEHGAARGRRSGVRGRAQRGDVRTAVLLVLAEQAMHGYQIMQTMSDRTGGAWRPSPGAVYPTIAQLADEGLVTVREQGGRRLVTLTTAGGTYLRERSARLGDPFDDFRDEVTGPDLRDPLHELQAAVRQIAVGGTVTQVQAAAAVLAVARRSLYLILAGEEDPPGE